MSSATNDKRGLMEDEFQRRFHDAEASPSPDLWARIDHDLTMQENKHYKERMVLYRQLAAACFVLFILAGAALTYHYKTEDTIGAGVASVQGNANAELSQNETAQAAPEAAAQPAVTSQPLAANGNDTKKENLQSINPATLPKALASATSAGQSINAKGSRVKPATLGIGAAVANVEYSINSASDDAGQPATFASTGESSPGNGNPPSRYNIGMPFYSSARQAITSVPLSYLNKTQQSTAGAAGYTKSLVELQHPSAEEFQMRQKKAKELAIALNNTTANKEKEEKQEGEDSRWAVGLAYAPSYFDQNINMPGRMMNTVSVKSMIAGGPDKNTLTSEYMDKARDEFEANTDPAFSYAAEAKASFNLFKKIKLLAGVGFTQNTARTKSSYIINQYVYKPDNFKRVPMPGTTVFLPSLNNNFTTDSISVNKTDDFYINYRYRHITLPVGVQYEGGMGKDWFWYASGGMAANFLVETAILASTTEVMDVTYKHNDDSPFRKVQFSGNVSLGVGKRLSNMVSVTAGPEFRGFLNSMLAEPDKALAPQGNPYTLGLNMSVNYRLSQ